MLAQYFIDRIVGQLDCGHQVVVDEERPLLPLRGRGVVRFGGLAVALHQKNGSGCLLFEQPFPFFWVQG